MNKRELKALILKNLKMTPMQLQVEVANKDILQVWIESRSGHRPYIQTIEALYNWAKENGYLKMGDIEDFEIATPTVSARVKERFIHIHDLELFTTQYRPCIVDANTLDGIIKFLKAVPRLVKTIEADRQYIAEQYTPIRTKYLDSKKNTADRQHLIETTIHKELQDFTVTTRRKKHQIVASVTLDNVIMDYPIANKEADNLSAAIERLKMVVANFKSAPYGTRLSKKS